MMIQKIDVIMIAIGLISYFGIFLDFFVKEEQYNRIQSNLNRIKRLEEHASKRRDYEVARAKANRKRNGGLDTDVK